MRAWKLGAFLDAVVAFMGDCDGLDDRAAVKLAIDNFLGNSHVEATLTMRSGTYFEQIGGLRATFERYDAGRKGHLTRKEARKLLRSGDLPNGFKVRREGAEPVLKTMAVGADEKIDFAEIENWWQRERALKDDVATLPPRSTN